MGGPDNNLERNHCYSVERDVNFNAERTTNINEFVNLFKKHDKLWMYRRVTIVNLWLDRALAGCDMADAGVTNTASSVRDDHITHDLCINS